jgi:hypothetical protein
MTREDTRPGLATSRGLVPLLASTFEQRGGCRRTRRSLVPLGAHPSLLVGASDPTSRFLCHTASGAPEGSSARPYSLFLAMGPDRSGLAVWRFFTKRGLLKKMLQTGAASTPPWQYTPRIQDEG